MAIATSPNTCSSDVMVVHDLQAGLALWNRNGYYSTLVTPEGEVIDPMGIVSGGNGTSLEGICSPNGGAFAKSVARSPNSKPDCLTKRREIEKLKAGTRTSRDEKNSSGNEVHRLELERVRFEHENRAANQEHERLTQTAARVDARTVRSRRPRSSCFDDELQRNRSMSQARTGESTPCDKRWPEASRVRRLCAAPRNRRRAVTQSRIRNAALGEKRDNTHVNLANRVALQEQTASEIATRQGRLADCQQQRGDIEQNLAQTEQALGQSRIELQDLEARLQSERQRYRTISMQLAEIGETIKELRPLGEACQEEQNGQFT